MFRSSRIRRSIAVISLSSLLAVSAIAAPARPALADGCTDPFEVNTSGENIAHPAATVTVPASINRSLCGFYDSDWVAFAGTAGTVYRAEITNFEAANDLSLAVFENNSGDFRHIASQSGSTVLEWIAPATNQYHVNINSGRSTLGLYGGGDYFVQLTAIGGTAPTQTVTSIRLNPSSVRGGTSATGTVSLAAPASTGGVVITLTSSNGKVASPPDSVTVPTGATSVDFPITTQRVRRTTSVTIETTNGSQTRMATLTVTR